MHTSRPFACYVTASLEPERLCVSPDLRMLSSGVPPNLTRLMERQRGQAPFPTQYNHSFTSRNLISGEAGSIA